MSIQVMVKVLNFLSVLVLTRLLLKSEIGIMSVLQTQSLLFTTFASLGLSSVVTIMYYSRSEVSDRETALYSCFIGAILHAVCWFMATIFLRSQLPGLVALPIDYRYLLMIAFFVGLVDIFQIPLARIFQFRSSLLAFGSVTLLPSLVPVGSGLLCMFLRSVNVESYFYGVFAGSVASVCFYIVLYAKVFKNVKPSFADIKKYFAVGYKMVILSVLSISSVYITRNVLFKMYRPEAAAEFMIGNQLASAFSIFSYSIELAWLPFCMQFADAPRADQERLGVFTHVFIVVSAALILVAVLFGAEFLRFFFGASYASSHAPMVATLIQLFLATLCIFFQAGFYFRRQAESLPRWMLFPSIVGALLSFSLAYAYGITGACIAVAASNFIALLWQIYVNKRLNLPDYNYHYAKMGVAICLLAGGLYITLFQKIEEASWMNRVGMYAAAMAVLLTLFWRSIKGGLNRAIFSIHNAR